jgi:hypothetical protein
VCSENWSGILENNQINPSMNRLIRNKGTLEIFIKHYIAIGYKNIIQIANIRVDKKCKNRYIHHQAPSAACGCPGKYTDFLLLLPQAVFLCASFSNTISIKIP